MNESEIDRILNRVEEIRRAAVESVRPVYAEGDIVPKVDFHDVPGLRLLVLSKLLIESFHNHLTTEQAYGLLLNPKAQHPRITLTSNEATSRLNELFKEELASLRKSIDGIELQTQSGQPHAMEFLLNDPVRSRVRELAEILSAYAWGSLLHSYNANPNTKDLSPTACDGFLKARFATGH